MPDPLVSDRLRSDRLRSGRLRSGRLRSGPRPPVSPHPRSRDRLAAAVAAIGLTVVPLAPVSVSAHPSTPPVALSSLAVPLNPIADPSNPAATSGTAETPSGSAASGPGAPSGPTAGGPANALGLRLYQQHCAWCHGQNGQGTGRGPTLEGVGPAKVDFMLTTGRMPYRDQKQYLQHNPSAFAAEEISALNEYVGSLGSGQNGAGHNGDGQQIPQVHPRDAALGRAIFQRHCSACHSSTGMGGALNEGRIAPPLFEATPTQVGEAIRTGPYVMPKFPASVISDQDIDDIAAYVQVLQNQRGDLDRGGWAFGRVGPFTEGAIAWGFGILLLVLFARLLGSRE